jgi:hypothetical protein
MRRDTTLITDPNSLFAISRALRKQIVRTDPDPQNRNNAIRDEKHIAYKSTGKGGAETFKYDILTSLEQLDNMFLELETVVPRITNEPAGRVGRPAGAKNKPKAKKTGAGYKGGALPDLPKDLSIMSNLKGAMKSASSSPLLKKLLRAFVPQVDNLLERYSAGEITNDDVIDSMDDAYEALDEKDRDNLTGDEKGGMATIFNALFEWIGSLPTNAPEALAEPEPVTPRRRVVIPPATGNEFVVSTLSKINVLLIKLIAEYNGKILANYKDFLQSDLQEIANKVNDSLLRFRDLQDNVLKDFSKGAKAADIDKFVSTIDKNFSRFTALVSRSIANFVNPNITLLPNFSQQLSTQMDSQERREGESQVVRNKNFDDRVDKLVKKYIPIREEIQRVENEVYEPLREKYIETGESLGALEKKFNDGSITKRERLAFVVLSKQFGRQQKELDKVARRLTVLQDKRNAIEDMPEYGFFPRGI